MLLQFPSYKLFALKDYLLRSQLFIQFFFNFIPYTLTSEIISQHLLQPHCWENEKRDLLCQLSELNNVNLITTHHLGNFNVTRNIGREYTIAIPKLH